MAGIIIHGNTGAAAAGQVIGAAAEGAADGIQIRAELDERIAQTKQRQQQMELLAKAAKLKETQDAAQKAWNEARVGIPGAPEKQGDVPLDHPTVNFTPTEMQLFKGLSPEQQQFALKDLDKRRKDADKSATLQRMAESIAIGRSGLGLYNGGGEGHSSPIAEAFYDQADAAMALLAKGDITEMQATGRVQTAMRGARQAQLELQKRKKLVDSFAAKQQEIMNGSGDPLVGDFSSQDKAKLDHLENVWSQYEKGDLTAEEAAAFAAIDPEQLEIITQRTVRQFSQMEADRSHFQSLQGQSPVQPGQETAGPAQAPVPGVPEVPVDAGGTNTGTQTERRSGVPIGEWVSKEVQSATQFEGRNKKGGRLMLQEVRDLQKDLRKASLTPGSDERVDAALAKVLKKYGVQVSEGDPGYEEIQELLQTDINALWEKLQASKTDKAAAKKNSSPTTRRADPGGPLN